MVLDSGKSVVGFEANLALGELKEIDKPSVLLANPNSMFSKLVASALEANSQNKTLEGRKL